MPSIICRCGCEFFSWDTSEDVCRGCMSERLARQNLPVCGTIAHKERNQYVNARRFLRSDGVCRLCRCRGRVTHDFLCSACSWYRGGSSRHGTRLHEILNEYDQVRVNKRIATEREMHPITQAINREEASEFHRILAEAEILRRHMPIIESECAICMENFARTSVRRVLPCRHQFHEGCVNTWIQIHHNCPTCRAAVV